MENIHVIYDALRASSSKTLLKWTKEIMPFWTTDENKYETTKNEFCSSLILLPGNISLT